MKRVWLALAALVLTAVCAGARIAGDRDSAVAADNGTALPDREEIKYVALTFDDGPSPRCTPQLLDGLKERGVRATFFVVGAYVRNRPEFTRAIYDEGHLLANHSYTHDKEVLSASFSSCLNDFQRTENIVSETLGFPLSMPILRVPYGASTIPVGFRTQLQELGYLWIDWNALNGDTESGVKSDEDALERAYSTAERYADGDIVMLVHDGKKRTIKRIIQRCGCDKILPLTLVYIFYLILHGHLSPGGGFQGGGLMVAVVILIYLGHGYDVTLKSLRPGFLHHSEGFLSFLYIIAALLGVVYLGNFCQNVFSDIGNIGDLFSTGTIFIMDTIVGFKVITGVGVLAISMLGLLVVKDIDYKK